MASYHRVLATFDRSVQDKSLECSYDIDPWDILIDEKRWPGKIRLIGFVDVFFLICYSGTSRFEKGIIIYKNDDAIHDTLERAGSSEEEIDSYAVNKEDKDFQKVGKKYFRFQDAAGSLDYTITSLGHPVDVKTEYPKSWLKQYTIKIRKNKSLVLRKRIERALNQHSFGDLMLDVVRLGIVSHAELMALLMSKTVVGTATDDAFRKYMGALGVGGGTSSSGLSGDRP